MKWSLDSDILPFAQMENKAKTKTKQKIKAPIILWYIRQDRNVNEDTDWWDEVKWNRIKHKAQLYDYSTFGGLGHLAIIQYCLRLTKSLVFWRWSGHSRAQIWLGFLEQSNKTIQRDVENEHHLINQDNHPWTLISLLTGAWL